MPIRRLFGLLVCALSLLSVPASPAVAQTVSFIDGSGADAASYVERSRVYVRVADPAADLSPGSLDIVSVTLTTTVSQDWESLTLTETDFDSGVFEGSMPLDRRATPGQPDLLETAVDPGPPVVRDTLTVEYGAATDNASMVGARIRILDGYGRPASGFTQDDWIHIRVEEHRYMSDPGFRDLLTVAVDAPASGDDELVTVRETSGNSGIFEGKLQAALFATADGNGVVGAAPGNFVRARFDVYDAPETLEVQAPLVGSRAEILDHAGEPSEYVFESSTLRLQVFDAQAGSPAVVDTVQVLMTCQISPDEETITLTENGPDTGVYEGDLPTNFYGGYYGDGVLDTGESEGPPHQFDTIYLSYTGPGGSASDSVTTYGSETRFVDAWGNEAEAYAIGSTAYVRVVDHNIGLPGQVDNAYAHLRSLTTNETETIVLQETGPDTSTYIGSIDLVDHPTGSVDSKLRVQVGEDVRVLHADMLYSSSADLARVRNNSLSFVDEQGRPTGELVESGTARIRMHSSVSNQSPGSPDTASVAVDSRDGGDLEIVQLMETGNDTDVFVGQIQMDFVSSSAARDQDGTLETSNDGTPDPAPDVVTARMADARAVAVTVGARVQLVDASGQDAEVFAAGQQVGVRVTDHNRDLPYTQQTLPVQVYSDPDTGDQEQIMAVETGMATGVFEGLVPTRASSTSTPGDGTLDLRSGGRIEARHSHYNDPRMSVDSAAVAASEVSFVDAGGQPADTYLEGTEAYVRLVYSAGNLSPSSVETVTVTLTSAIAADSETLTLSETGPDTGVFAGSIPLSVGSTSPGNGSLETSWYANPREQDTLTVTHETTQDTATTVGSRTWFVDAWGNPIEAYAQGTTAYIRVEDHGADTPGYDTLNVTVSSLGSGDSESLVLQEVELEGGIFEGSIRLDAASVVTNDGALRVQPAEQIEAANGTPQGAGYSTARAWIRYASIEFVDAEGRPTDEALEGSLLRLRVTSTSAGYGDTINVTVRGENNEDEEIAELRRTVPSGSVYEGEIQLRTHGPEGTGSGNGVLETFDSGPPNYRGDELTATYQDATATAVTVPSRVWFLDAYGRVAASLAVGEPAGVRVEDHNQDDPLERRTILVTVREAGSGDSETIELTETGYDTNVYEGAFATADDPVGSGDGVLQVQPGRVIEAEHQNVYMPNPTVAQATMAGASIVFVDAQGRPAEVYFERTRAYVRVTDTFADFSPSADSITVTLESELGLDSESLTLTETGPTTGVFEGSIPLLSSSANADNGFLETSQLSGPPHQFDTLRASYLSIAGTVSATAGTIASRTWFLDAYGNEAETYAAGTTAWVRVEDHNANGMPSHYDQVQVTVSSLATGDSETLTLRETTRDSGIFEGSVRLEKVDYSTSPSPNDGRLQSVPADVIQAVHTDAGGSSSSDSAQIRYSSAHFVDEAGAPTQQVVEGSVARLRVESWSSSPVSSITVSVRSGNDEEIVTLTETSSGSQVYEGTVQLLTAPSGSTNNGRLETSNSGIPDYLGEELTVTYQDATGAAITIPSRVRFFDGYGRVATTFAVGERVGVRVEDHNQDDPLIRRNMLVNVREAGSGDSETIELTETGYDTNVYEGTFATTDAAVASGDSVLQVQPGRVIEAERQNVYTPYPTVAQATMSGASVVFVNAQGQPAEVYFERTRAYVRVTDTFADFSPSADSITVTLQSLLGLDSESLTLTETGPATGVFEGSMLLLSSSANPNNGFLETSQFNGPPHEFDTLRASYQSISGTVSATAGTVGSRTWFLDAYGNEAETYAAGTTAWVRVEDHIAGSMPGHYDITEVTVYAPSTGDTETVSLRETTRESGIFEGSLRLEKEDYPPSPSPNDGRLQSMPGEQIEVVHTRWSGGSSSDRAVIRYSSAEFIDETGEPTQQVVEGSVARLRVASWSSVPVGSISVSVRSGNDEEIVTLTETSSGSQVYEGTVQLLTAPSGSTHNGRLETSNSGIPDYLGDELTVTYQDAEGRAVTIPSRIRFFDSYGRVATTFAVGERVGVRVEDHNQDDPLIRRKMLVNVREAGAGDSETIELTETGYDTNVYEGTFATTDAAVASGDGVLQVQPGRVIEAERQNVYTPYPTVAQATMAGASVVFVDEQGQAAELYFERTRAYVRVSDTFADFSPSADSITVTLQSMLGLDSESLSLTETGPTTGVFEGSIALSPGSANPNNGYLETSQFNGPPHEYDTLTASYLSIAGTVSASAGTIGSRTWFLDAYGNEAETYAAGTTAWVRVEDHIAGSMPGHYDITEVTVYAPSTGDTETVSLRETTRESGIFEGSVRLEKEDYPPSPSPNDGRLQSMPGEQIEVVHTRWSGGSSSDRAVIRYSSAEFIDEAGAPTQQVVEGSVARLRVASWSSVPVGSISVSVRSGNDEEIVTLTETSSGSQVYEGTVQLLTAPSGSTNNGRLETSNSGIPDYLGDELTVTYQDAEGRAVTIPSRIGFFDGYGRVATTFAVGEQVGVRVEDHNQDDPLIRRNMLVSVREAGSGDSETVELLETGYDTNIYQGTIATSDAAVASGDGVLQVQPGRVIEAERQNVYTPYPTVAQAKMAGASVVFVDEQGQAAELYFERTRAYVRVSDTFADFSPSADFITVTLQSMLGLDSESLSLTETGPTTGVFEGSIALSPGSANPNNGYLETGQFNGPPHEYDTLTASYPSIAGTVSDTAGTIGSRTWFIDAYGNETDSYAAGNTAWVRVEDHVAGSMPGHYDITEVTVYAPSTGDTETVSLRETTRESGIFEGSVRLEKEDYPPSPSPNDGRLQSMPGEQIEVVHTRWSGGSSSDRAVIRYSSAEFIDEAGAPTQQVVEGSVARLRVASWSSVPVGSISVSVRSGNDEEIVTLTETSSGSQVYEGTVQLHTAPGGSTNNGRLETSNSGIPDYLGDELTVTYQDAEGRAVTIPSRIGFFDSFGRVATTFAVGETVGVRVEDHNQDDPLIRRNMLVSVREAGAGDSETVELLETGYDTNIYEGTFATSDAAVASGDGVLQVQPGRVIQAERQNVYTPNPTVAQAVMSGASVVFVDEQGQAAELYFESTRAYVRVSDTFADFSPSPDSITVTLQSMLGLDSEALSLTETGGSTGMFEGSIALSPSSASPNNGLLETSQFNGPPHEYDTLTASYQSIAGTVSDTAGTIGSRTSFINQFGSLADSYAAGATAFVRVEDYNADQPGVNDTVQVTLRSLSTGDVETVPVPQVFGNGLFEGNVPLSRAPVPVPGDGALQSVPGEEIEVVHADLTGTGSSSDLATIRNTSAVIRDPSVGYEGEVLENGTALIEVIDKSGSPGGSVVVRSLYGADEENVSLTSWGQGSYSGTMQLSWVPQGGGTPGNGVLETSNSGSPEYLQDELTAVYADAEARGVTVPSRILFAELGEAHIVTEYPAGSIVRVWVHDQNANDPTQVDTTTVLLSTPGDSETITLTEVGQGEGRFLGELPSSGSPGAPQDGTLTAGLGIVITGEHQNVHTPVPTEATIPVTGHHAPQAGNDTAETVEEAPVTINVLANDFDADGDYPLFILWPGQGAHGTVAWDFDEGTATYTPEPGFIGVDTFTYILVDRRGGQARGTVTVTVLEGNDPPVAINDSATTPEDQPVNIDVLVNDTDPDDDPLRVRSVTDPDNGTAVIETDGTITFTPDPNWSGVALFDYEVEDLDGQFALGGVAVTVTPVNDPPVAADDSAATDEDTAVTVAVLANDTDLENDTLDVTAVTQGTNGAVVLNANDTAAYTPNANFHGTDSFTYTVSDGNGGTDTATVTVTVDGANDAPVAVDDTATVDEDSSVTVNVLGNDSDADDDTLDVTAVTQGTNGAVTLDPVTYTPSAGFHGTDSFTYTISDGTGGGGSTDTATVTVTVNPVNDAPMAVDDSAVTDEDSTVSVTVLANDTDPDDDTLDVTAVTQGANGAVVINPDNTVTYSPNANFHGTDSFTYTVSDGNGGTDTATVNVTVNSANDAPNANDDAATVAEDGSVSIPVLGNDSDADNDNLTVTAVAQGTNGAVTLNPVTYTPDADFHGTDSFTYTISDGNGGTDSATVTVTVTPINDAPVANDDAASVVEDGSVTVNVLGNDADADNDNLTVTAVTQGANGAVTLTPVTYTPNPNFFGTDSFTYTLTDGNGGTDSATVTVTIAPANDNLTANDDSATVAEDASVNVNVLGNDSDPENDVLNVQSVTQGTNGAVVINPDRTVTYTPNADFHGADSFTYTASDGNGGTDSATVTITVTPVNDAPVAGDDTASVVEDGSVAVTVLGNDADVDEDLLSVTSATQGANGSVAINPDDTVTYTPAADFNGTDSFTYTISDGNGEEDTATVTVTVGAANDPPTANGDTASTVEDNAVTVAVLTNDSDPENDTLTVASVTQAANGAVVINANETVTYTPGANFHGTDSFTYTASDGNGGTDTATVTVTVTPVNDAPVANDDPASVAEDGSVTVTVLTNDTDVENDALDVTAVTQGTHGSVVLNANDTVTYTPAANFNGTDSFTYTISDGTGGGGGTDTATVNVTVGAANDAPVANDDSATVAEDGTVTASVLGNDTDLDNDTLTVTAASQGANGAVTLNPVTYTPNANFFGTDSFTYTVSDGNGGTDTATVTVTVTAVNDAPVAVNDSATTTAETPVTIQVRTNDTDVDSATLTITAVTQGAHGTVAINAGQTVTYTPATAWVGPDTFTYTISDGAGGTATATVSVDVQAPPRVSTNIQVLYAFDEGSGTTVNDTSGVGEPLSLTIANASAVTWLPGALSIDSANLVQSAGAATKVINACKSTNEVTVEAWVLPANLSQTGPAAIVTISQNHTKRDLTLGQSGSAYNGQLRTSSTGQGGTQLNAGGTATLDLSHVVYTRSSSGAVRIYVNGTQVASATLSGSFSSWASYELGLGGELSGTRYWTGDLHLVAIYNRALTANEVRQNFLAGAN